MSTVLKPLYGSSVPFTVTNLQSLANSSTLVAGWAGAVVDNTSDLAVDQILTWQIKSGSTPTVNLTGEIWCYEILDDTPTYPDTITGSEGTVTFTSVSVKQSGLKFVDSILFDAAANRVWSGTARVKQVFGGTMPKKWGPVFINGSGASLASSANIFSRTPVQYQYV